MSPVGVLFPLMTALSHIIKPHKLFSPQNFQAPHSTRTFTYSAALMMKTRIRYGTRNPVNLLHGPQDSSDPDLSAYRLGKSTSQSTGVKTGF